MTTIEKLGRKYFEHFGTSPEMSFWCWLDAHGVSPDEDDLMALYDDDCYWPVIKPSGEVDNE